MFCNKSKATAKQDFEECINTMFDSDSEEDSARPRILFSYFYSHLDSSHLVENSVKTDCNKPSNLHIVSGAKCKLDFDHHVLEVFFKFLSRLFC